MKKALTILGGFIAIFLTGLVIVSWWVSRPIYNEVLDGDPSAQVVIAPHQEAVTFARTVQGKVVIVESANATGIFGQIITSQHRDGVAVFNDLGFAGIIRLRQKQGVSNLSHFTWQQLGLPFAANYPQIAAGANFLAHAEEVGIDDDPFLFPKLSEATSWNSPVLRGTRLDYEVELCALTLNNYLAQSPGKLGYVLCGDFTERWTLISQLDLQAPMGTTGFPEGKGGKTRLPIGPLLVIPKDEEQFYQNLELSLYVNGKLRQRATAGLMIWSPVEIVNKALTNCEVGYHNQGELLHLTPCESIEARTLILTGTPEGVGFHLLNLWSSIFYLNPRDEVLGSATHLGVTRNVVE